MEITLETADAQIAVFPAGFTYLADPPVPPSGLTATALDPNRVALSWVDTAIDEDGYRVLREQGSAGLELASLAPGATSFLDDTAAASTAYRYRVVAFGPGGASASAPADVTTPPDRPLPATLAAVVSGTAVALSWADVASEDAYSLERGPAGRGVFVEVAALPAGTTGFVDVGAPLDAASDYRLFALNAGGASVPSNFATALLPPLAATGLSATAVSPSRVALSWTDASQSEGGFRDRAAHRGGRVRAGRVCPGQRDFLGGRQRRLRHAVRLPGRGLQRDRRRSPVERRLGGHPQRRHAARLHQYARRPDHARGAAELVRGGPRATRRPGHRLRGHGVDLDRVRRRA